MIETLLTMHHQQTTAPTGLGRHAQSLTSLRQRPLV